MTVSETLRQAVEDSGFYLNGISAASGISQSSLHRFYTGERDMRLQNADKLAEYLGLVLVKKSSVVPITHHLLFD